MGGNLPYQNATNDFSSHDGNIMPNNSMLM